MQYIKIKEAITEQIESGYLTPGNKLPSERKLAETFDTTRVTLREALSSLEAEGKIFREDRRGWFIAPGPLRYDPARGLSFNAMAEAQGRKPKTEVICAKAMLANKQAAQLLELPPFSDVCRIDRVRYLDDRPVAFVTNYLRPERVPGLVDIELTQSLTDILRDEFGVVYKKVRYRLSTSSFSCDTAAALRATSGAPAMVVERMNYDAQGTLVSCDIEYWRHDSICIDSVVELV